MEARHGCGTTDFCLVVDECTVALRDQKDGLNVDSRLVGEVVLEVDDMGRGW